MGFKRRHYPAMANMDTRCTWPVTLKGDSHPISCFRLRKIGTLCRQHEAIRIRSLTRPANEAIRSTTMPTSLPTMTTLKRRRNARLKQAKLDAKVWKPWGKDMPEDGRSFLAYCSFNKSQYMVVLERWKNPVGTEIVSIRLWPDGKDATHDFTHWRPCVGGPIVDA